MFIKDEKVLILHDCTCANDIAVLSSVIQKHKQINKEQNR